MHIKCTRLNQRESNSFDLERKKYNILILNDLMELVEKYPSQRFGQIIENYVGGCQADIFFEEPQETYKRVHAHVTTLRPEYLDETGWCFERHDSTTDADIYVYGTDESDKKFILTYFDDNNIFVRIGEMGENVQVYTVADIDYFMKHI